MILSRFSLMSHSWRFALLAAIVVSSGFPQASADPAKKDSLDKDYRNELPRIPPKEPDEALAAFQIQPGFRVEVAASEPLVVDPVAMAFDGDGCLFVVEMRGYSEDREKRLGRVRRLEDTDGDGRYDKSSIYVDDLAWPTAVICYNGGVFVGAAPDILYAKDKNGDGRADERRVVFTGFGVGNVQGRFNSFRWGLDNRIHVAASSNGGRVRSATLPDAKPISVRGRDFAFDPKTLRYNATSGGAQNGMSFDRWGNKFLCSNSDHIQMAMFEDRYVARNPYLAAPSPRRSIAVDGKAAKVFRTSPVEPWRIVRTRLRVSGLVKGPIEGGGTPAGYFTGSTGITIYRGDTWPADFRGNAFIADCGSNLVHRKRLVPDGVGFKAHRVEQGREFLASKDIWFRPVQMGNGPDGNLYIADMYREVVEHPESIPGLIKRHLDLTSGRDRGRIYRVVPENAKQQKPPRLDNATIAELVAALADANGWRRETAARLLYQRQDRSAIAPLRKLARQAERPVARIRALYALDGIGSLSADVVFARLDDVNPRVREHAVRLSEKAAGDSAAIQTKLALMVTDRDPRVRYQLAFTLGELSGRARNTALSALARRGAADTLVRMAIMSSLAHGSGEVLAELIADAKFRRTAAGRQMLLSLVRQIGKQNRPGDVALLLRGVAQLPPADQGLLQAITGEVVRAAGPRRAQWQQQLAKATGAKSDKLLADLVESAKKIAVDEKQKVADRVEAVRALQLGSWEIVGPTLSRMIDHRQPRTVQMAVISALGAYDDRDVPRLLIRDFRKLSPRVRSEALAVIFSRRDWIGLLLDAIGQKRFAARSVDPARQQLLLSHADKKIRKRAAQVFDATGRGGREKVLQDYAGVLKMKGDATRGRAVFRKVCSACHRLEGYGHELGANLSGIRNRPPDAILTSILDPNREVDPRYISYQVITNDGRVQTGIIDSETATSVVLKRSLGVAEPILRVDIDELESSGLSVMPEGLEREIDKRAMADLLEFLLTVE